MHFINVSHGFLSTIQASLIGDTSSSRFYNRFMISSLLEGVGQRSFFVT